MNDEKLIWEAYQSNKTKKLISEGDYLNAARQFFSQRSEEEAKIIADACTNYFEFKWLNTFLHRGELRYILEETSTFSESNARKEQSLASEFDKYMNDFYLENGYDRWKTKVKTSAKEKYFSGSFKLAEQFFSQRDDESSKLINGAKNKSEKEYRIQWLSEGSLKYHLLQRSVQHGGDPEELELYREYLRYKNLFLMKNGYSGSK
jgi:hypothetical protein